MVRALAGCTLVWACSMSAASADETRAIVDAATAFNAAHVFTRVNWTRASLVRSRNVALFSALNGFAAGGAILERSAGAWRVVTVPKGLYGPDLLRSFGIPAADVERLALPCPPGTPYISVQPAPATSAHAHFASVRYVRIPPERVRFTTAGAAATYQTVPAVTVAACE